MPLYPLGGAVLNQVRGSKPPRSAALRLARTREEALSLAPDFERLADEQERGIPCTSLPVLLGAVDERVPRIAALLLDDEPVALLPLARRRTPFGLVFRWLGEGELPRVEPLVSKRSCFVDAHRLLRVVTGLEGRASLIDVAGLRPRSAGANWLLDTTERHPGWHRVAGGVRECEMALDASWPATYAALSCSTRRRAAALLEARKPERAARARVGRPRSIAELGPLAAPLVTAGSRRVLLERETPRGAVLSVALFTGATPLGMVCAWQRGAQAVELGTVLIDGAPVEETLAALRVSLLRALVEAGASSLLLENQASAEPGAPASRQPRLVGAPWPGPGRAIARTLARLSTAAPGSAAARCALLFDRLVGHRPVPAARAPALVSTETLGLECARGVLARPERATASERGSLEPPAVLGAPKPAARELEESPV